MTSKTKWIAASFIFLFSCLFSCWGRGSEIATQSLEFFRPLEGRWVREVDGVISHLEIDLIKSAKNENRVEIRVESCPTRTPLKCASALQAYSLNGEDLVAQAGLKTVAAQVDDLTPSRVAIRYRDATAEVVHSFELVNDSVLSLNSNQVTARFVRGPVLR